MKFGKLMGFVAVSSFAATMAMAGTSNMDFAKMYEKECQVVTVLFTREVSVRIFALKH